MLRPIPQPNRRQEVLRWAFELTIWLRWLVDEIARLAQGSSASLSAGSWRLVSINQATKKVTIGTGLCFRGKDEAVIVGETEVEVSGGTVAHPVYAYISYGYTARSGEIGSKAVQDEPHPTSDAYVVPLHSFYTLHGKIIHVRQHRFSDIDIPGFA